MPLFGFTGELFPSPGFNKIDGEDKSGAITPGDVKFERWAVGDIGVAFMYRFLCTIGVSSAKNTAAAAAAVFGDIPCLGFEFPAPGGGVWVDEKDE